MAGHKGDLDAPIHVVKGSDDTLRNEAVVDLVSRLVGDGDRGLMLDEHSGADQDLSAAVAAAQTPPFLTERRVVVVRHAGQFSKAEDVAALVGYLADPLPTTSLVVVWEKAPGDDRLGAMPKKLADAVKGAGGETVTADVGGTAKAKADWWSDQLGAAPVKLDARAAEAVREALGEDVGQLPALLAKLASTYGEGARLGVGEVEPQLGQAGAVPPWDLTDAIDRGDTARALDLLHRMLEAGGRHPLQLMATLQGHYGRMLRLDGSGVRNEKQAAEVLGMKGSTFPAKKALERSRALGHGGVAKAVALLAEADLTLRGGGVSWPGELVLEVLVARLSKLGPRSRAAAGRR